MREHLEIKDQVCLPLPSQPQVYPGMGAQNLKGSAGDDTGTFTSSSSEYSDAAVSVDAAVRCLRQHKESILRVHKQEQQKMYTGEFVITTYMYACITALVHHTCIYGNNVCLSNLPNQDFHQSSHVKLTSSHFNLLTFYQLS